MKKFKVHSVFSLVIILVAMMTTSTGASNEIFNDSGQSLGNFAGWRVALGDLDGDGDLDAFVVNCTWNDGGHPNEVWLNNGTGVFVSSGQSFGGKPSFDVALGDLDSDGDLDAIVANSSNVNRVWLNDGTGIFNPAQGIGSSSGRTDSVALGDLDDDGDLDAFFANHWQPNEVWLNDGMASFTDTGQRLGGDAFSHAVELGDVDNDDDLDAFIANGEDQPNEVWLNNGQGFFSDSGQRLDSSFSRSRGAALGDLDNDGDIDIIVANILQANQVWLNDGTGTFSAGQSVDESFSADVALGDLDDDGDLDAFFANYHSSPSPNHVWFNDGTGVFTFGQSLGDADSRGVALGDLDGDDDLDAFVANYVADRVWLNESQTPTVIFYDGFSDGELDNDPTWTYLNSAWNIIDGKLHADGLNMDGSGRYRSIFRSDFDIQAPDYVEMSYQGKLKSIGNPQIGRGIQLHLVGEGHFYQLRLQRSVTSGFPVDQFSFALSISQNNSLVDLIVSDFQPEYDQDYVIRAVRQNGVWTLYVDDLVIGTSPDPHGTIQFDRVFFDVIGSVVIDDVTLKTIPPNQPPGVTASGPYNMPEGGSIIVESIGNDPDGNDLIYAWDLNNDGIFETPGQNVPFTSDDGPTSYTVAVQVTDTGGLTATDQTIVTVQNVAPTADFYSSGDIDEGNSVTLTFSNQFDPSPVDMVAGFLYSFDCTDDGVFEIVDSIADNYACSYDDNGVYTARGRVTDKDGDSTEYTVDIAVLNVSPTATFINETSSIDEGESITLLFTDQFDPSSVDTITGFRYSFDCTDDGVFEVIDDTEDSSVCSYDDNGVFTARGRIKDKDGDFTDYTVDITVLNVAPTATFANDTGPINEGESVNLVFADPFDPSNADTVAGFTYAYDCTNDGMFEISDNPTTSFACDYPDNGVFTALGHITDKDGDFTEYTVEVLVNNLAPVVDPITAPVDPVAVDLTISANADFTDAGVLDTHTAVWDWGDGTTSSGVVTETDGSGSVTGDHTYTEAGVYTIILTVTDKDGDSGISVYEYVVVYDPASGFVTGGGWIDSPASAYSADPTLVGRANFGFVAKYKKGALVPTGETEFHFQEANLNFHSESYDWLVISEGWAQFKGAGTINGEGNYGFFITMIDGSTSPDRDEDLFRIKIWNWDNGSVVYDSQLGDSNLADPTISIGGGSLVIHKSKNK